MLRISHLDIGYEKKTLIKDLHFDLAQGKVCCILGKNGVGKSSFLKSLYDQSASSKISWKDKSFDQFTSREIAQIIAFITPNRQIHTSMTVEEFILLGNIPHKKQNGYVELLNDTLESLKLKHLLNRSIYSLSDGEFQKIQICRALQQNTPIIVLDEPTSFLDYPSRIELYSLLQKIAQEQNKSILFTAHDIELAWRFTDYSLLLNGKGDFVYTSSETLKNGELLNCFFSNPFFSFNSEGRVEFI
jgi:iron complex transport system ATP-binding protein